MKKNNPREKEVKDEEYRHGADKAGDDHDVDGNRPCNCMNAKMFPHRKKKCALKGTATAFTAGVTTGVAVGGVVVGAAYTSLLAAPAIVGHAAVAGVSQGVSRGISSNVENSITGNK